MLRAAYSPLTCAKEFQIIPRVTKINTPDINVKISKRFGLPSVANSSAFKAEYCKKREELRKVNGRDQNSKLVLQSSSFSFPCDGNTKIKHVQELIFDF